MNILYIVTYRYAPAQGGGQFAITNQLNTLATKVNLFVFGVNANQHKPDIKYKTFDLMSNSKYRYINFKLLSPIGDIIEQNKIDTVILEHPYMGWLLYLLKKKYKIKTAIRSQNIEFKRFRDLKKWWWWILRGYEKWVHNQVDYVFPITEDDYSFFEKQKLNAELINFPFGTHFTETPSDKENSRQAICKTHNIDKQELILLYNGVLSYLPNKIGLDIILNQINPSLQKSHLKYKIIICGKGLDASYNDLKDHENIIYCGFVDDIFAYFKGADIFLNPIIGGGGIKTKLVDALSVGLTTISSVDGAHGIKKDIVGNKLVVTENYNGKQMAEKIIEMQAQQTELRQPTPKEYYEYYNWNNIVKRVLDNMD